jgi:hypothetical protein
VGAIILRTDGHCQFNLQSGYELHLPKPLEPQTEESRIFGARLVFAKIVQRSMGLTQFSRSLTLTPILRVQVLMVILNWKIKAPELPWLPPQVSIYLKLRNNTILWLNSNTSCDFLCISALVTTTRKDS